MNGRIRCPLAAALIAILPGSEILSRRERAWHSATFSGLRVTLELAVSTNIDPTTIAEFCVTISEREFDLRRMFVADITILARSKDDAGRAVLLLEALLLEQ